MNDNDFSLNELVEREANIWACIYRAVNRKKDNNEFDEEEDSDVLPITRDPRYLLGGLPLRLEKNITKINLYKIPAYEILICQDREFRDFEESMIGLSSSMNDDYLLNLSHEQLIPTTNFMGDKKYPNLQVIHEADDVSGLEEESFVQTEEESFVDQSYGDSSNPEEPRAALEK